MEGVPRRTDAGRQVPAFAPVEESGMIAMSVRSWTTRHELGLFLFLAFLLSWALWPLVLLNADSSPLVPFGPLGAALIVTAVSGGWRGVLALVAQLGRWRVRPRWYVVALVGPFVLTALAGAVAVAAGAPSPGLGVYSDWSGVLASLVATAVIVGLFEEVGWRGFALPRMQRDHAALSAALALGLVWALWHLPELVSDSSEREPAPYLLAVLAYSVLITWLYNRTRGSLPVVILFHAAINTAARFLMPEFPSRYDVTAWWCYAAVYVLAAVAVVAVAGASRPTTAEGPGVAGPTRRVSSG
ncbi:CPBP family intramembrane metalloprotease [Nocardioides iriomotensis]|uniref:CPBP family intramembrane metalloprotease n=2 Tax=Nocardioides iriomotensis TaxID=715784 RepID=A0A4Q5J2Z0_9ACTN|nr:CPBP family intramembrane metalloprotease [Nocardioides iriomotensis]